MHTVKPPFYNTKMLSVKASKLEPLASYYNKVIIKCAYTCNVIYYNYYVCLKFMKDF